MASSKLTNHIKIGDLILYYERSGDLYSVDLVIGFENFIYCKVLWTIDHAAYPYYDYSIKDFDMASRCYKEGGVVFYYER